jgi:hypothetical protein
MNFPPPEIARLLVALEEKLYPNRSLFAVNRSNATALSQQNNDLRQVHVEKFEKRCQTVVSKVAHVVHVTGIGLLFCHAQ